MPDEPVPGGDMEDVPAAREPRQATAVYTVSRGPWHTDGRVVFKAEVGAATPAARSRSGAWSRIGDRNRL